MCLYFYFPKDTAIQKMKELFNISTTTDECRLWVYGCEKNYNGENTMNFCALITDLDDESWDKELDNDDNVRIRYICSIVYFLFVLGVPYINVRNKKS